MRFLADESCDFRVVERLRRAGHDVLAIVEVAPGTPDLAVIERARKEERILLTEDRDFGQLVYAARVSEGTGVLYLRCPEAARVGMPDHIASTVERLGTRLVGSFAVWTPYRVRLRRSGG